VVDDIEIDEPLLRALLRQQHPDLAELELREVEGGWDNRMWRLGRDLAVRLPRTPRAPSLLRTERRWLPMIAPSLALAAPPWDGKPVWLHGDLHPANVVVSDGTLSGVIDFGEMCGGDPATDLAAAWLVLPDGSASRLFDAYQVADEATATRARGWAALRCLHLISIGQMWERGHPGGKKTWGPAGRLALERVLAGGI
jgi:aminoglycoside phosphotransferase (APT) family kinase protein